MKKLEDIKKLLKENKKELKEKYGVRSIGIFGSFVRGEETDISDVDILVEFEKPMGLKFFEFANYLEGILGIRVDLLTFNAIKQKPRLWEIIKNELIYV